MPDEKDISEQERALIDKIKQMHDAALAGPNNVRKSTPSHKSNGPTNLEIYRGDYSTRWNSATDEDWEADYNANVTFMVVETSLPMLTDARPQISYVPRDSGGELKARVLTDLAGYVWDVCNMQFELTRGCKHSLVQGTGLYKTVWDADADDDKGMISTKALDPRNVVCDPHATRQADLRYVIEEFKIPRGVVKRLFPKASDNQQSVDVEHQNPAMDTRGMDVDDNTEVSLLEVWWHDEATITETEIDEDKTERKVRVKRYPHGRRTIISEDEVLLDTENPYPWLPYTFQPNYDQLEAINGMSEVEQIRGPQFQINDILNTFIDHFKVNAHGRYLVSTSSDIDTDSITREPGEFVRTNDINGFKPIPGAPIDNNLFGVFDRILQLTNTTSGIHEVTQGSHPSEITASGTKMELEQGAGRIRLKARMLEVALADIGRKWLWLMTNKMDTQRVLRITGVPSQELFASYAQQAHKEGSYPESGDLAEHGGVMMGPDPRLAGAETEDGTPMEFPPVPALKYQGGTGREENRALYFSVIPSMLAGEYDVHVDALSQLPMSKSDRAALAREGLQGQAIDGEAWMDMVSFPNKDQILARMGQMQQMGQQLQQMQAQLEQMGQQGQQAGQAVQQAQQEAQKAQQEIQKVQAQAQAQVQQLQLENQKLQMQMAQEKMQAQMDLAKVQAGVEIQKIRDQVAMERIKAQAQSTNGRNENARKR